MSGKPAEAPRQAPSAPVAPMALAAMGVVFGDIGTSPLYSLQTVFSIEHNTVEPTHQDVYGVISLVRSVLEPKIMAAQVDLPPLAALAAMYVGFCAFGVAGMVLCPMALLCVKQLHDSGWLRLWK